MLALVVQILLGILLGVLTLGVSVEPSNDFAPSAVAVVVDEEQEWREFHELAVIEYEDTFTTLFNSYETKWSKNDRLMIRRPGDKTFKFAKKG